jgi:DNA-binding MarR family transcriptional regulator
MIAVDALTQASERRPAAPIRSVRRATARRASNRRAYARSRQSDSDARIIDFLAHHPSSTIGDLAKSLNLDPEHVATCLTHLNSAGEIRRATHGYRAQRPARQSMGAPAS